MTESERGRSEEEEEEEADAPGRGGGGGGRLIAEWGGNDPPLDGPAAGRVTSFPIARFSESPESETRVDGPMKGRADGRTDSHCQAGRR